MLAKEKFVKWSLPRNQPGIQSRQMAAIQPIREVMILGEYSWPPSSILDQSGKNLEGLEGLEECGRQGNGHQMVTSQESTWNPVQTNGCHSTNKRSYDALRVVLAPSRIQNRSAKNLEGLERLKDCGRQGNGCQMVTSQ